MIWVQESDRVVSVRVAGQHAEARGFESELLKNK